eukprot:TRINITY_DN640_c0_g1_i1.p1 TRINITY_DN640_c0_g1~~TRINITY_DN640_c0_g1_i1.p1  ORF type:complete len:491 (+),score=64.54 TRINITY_DN640_c0_g1_i1:208-1680(+)
MAAIAASQEHSIRASGTQASVPDHDVCRLSYYLCCCTLYCGVDIIVDDLLDFKNAHKLPKPRQNAIFELAEEKFSASEMIDKTIFLDSTGELCGENGNIFLELKKVTNVLAVSSSALIGGNHTQITKVMVFRPEWLEQNYNEPLRRRQQQETLSKLQLLARELQEIVIEDVPGTNSLHCHHCKGLDAPCGCTHGCQPKQTTKCSAVHHCDHCKGIEGEACSCEKGCPQGKHGNCTVIHFSALCDGCRVTGIRGARYKCQKCFDYDLCWDCYRVGRHELTHPFSMIARVGSTPVPLKSRQQLDFSIGETNPNLSSNVSEKDSDSKIAMTDNKDTSCASFVGERMSISEMKRYLEENDIPYTGVREKRELLRLVWETQVECLGANELDRFIVAQCIEDAGGSGVAAKRRAVVAAFDSKYERKAAIAHSGKRFHQGDVVELCGLKKESMNGKLATVIRSELVNERMQVQLVDDSKVRLNIRPVNLQTASRDID